MARSIRTLIIGGEALEAEQTAFWQEAAPRVRMYNEYGPTETVVGCSVYEVTVEHRGRRTVPIGKPIANMSLYVLDAHVRPVPVGVVGEVFVGGSGLGRGYLNRPDLTAQQFVPHPFSQEPGARLYRTGDLARYLDDGAIEFLGRVDEQVKLRGYRIEPGEIEATLRLHPAVRDAVVQVREEAAGDTRLVAYIIAASEAVQLDDIRSLSAQHLPEYMVPSDLVLLQQFPLTPNGKIDRRALAALKPQRRGEQSRETMAPRTPLEEIVAGIWCQILQLSRVGVTRTSLRWEATRCWRRRS